MNRRVAIAIIVLLVCTAGGATGWFYLRDKGSTNGRVFVSGNIEAIEVDLSFRISGQIKQFDVVEGDRVEKDQIVALLDTDTLDTLQGGAKAEIAAARAVLDELEEGTRVETIEAARAIFNAAESRLKNARDEFNRYSGLFKEHAISASSFDTKETALKVAEEDYKNAAQRLQELEKGPREQQIRASRHRLEKAKWELSRIDLDIKHSTLRTPVSGVVLIKANEVGEVILPGAAVATVAAVDEVWLKGYVGERDLGRVKVGQQVQVTTDTFPDKTYPGVVTFISSRAEFTPKNVQTREERVKQVYRIKVTIKNPQYELKIGMPAEGYILVEAKGGGTQRGTSVEKPSS